MPIIVLLMPYFIMAVLFLLKIPINQGIKFTNLWIILKKLLKNIQNYLYDFVISMFNIKL